MSIYIYGRIRKKNIDDQTLRETIARSFSVNKNRIEQKDGNCTTYQNICNDNEIILSFVKEKKPPYNIYESKITNHEFQYTQLIIFDIRKDKALKDTYIRIVDFFIDLSQEAGSDILVTSDMYDEICLIQSQGMIWSKTFPYRTSEHHHSDGLGQVEREFSGCEANIQPDSPRGSNYV